MSLLSTVARSSSNAITNAIKKNLAEEARRDSTPTAPASYSANQANAGSVSFTPAVARSVYKKEERPQELEEPSKAASLEDRLFSGLMTDEERRDYYKQQLAEEEAAKDEDALETAQRAELGGASGFNTYGAINLLQNGYQPSDENEIDEDLLRTSRNVRQDLGRRAWQAQNSPYTLGMSSQQITEGPARELYEMGFAETDARMHDDRSFDEKVASGDIPQYARLFSDDRTVTVDDGLAANRTGQMMTGEQYIKYRDVYGLPGRPVEDIDPAALYSKQMEQDEWGFIPYIPDDEALGEFHLSAEPLAMSNVFSDLRDLRRNATDYTVSVNGSEYNGEDFDKAANAYLRSDAVVNAGATDDPAQAEPGAIPYVVTRDEEGNIIDAQLAEDGGQADFWVNVPMFDPGDGNMISYMDLMDMYDENTGIIKDEYADYGFGNIAKPVYGSPLEDGLDNVLPWLIDMGLSSAPYFWAPTAAGKALGDMGSFAQGINPDSRNYLTGTYNLISEDPTAGQKAAAVLGSAAMPFTERLWGPLGRSMLAPIGKGRLAQALGVSEKLGKSPVLHTIQANPAGRWIEGAVGEGLEEIPGNIVEDFRNQGRGLSGWYADDLYYDENGNLTTEDTGRPALDEQNRQMRDYDTPISNRLFNFVGDIPEAFIGGAALGGILGGGAVPSYIDQYYRGGLREHPELIKLYNGEAEREARKAEREQARAGRNIYGANNTTSAPVPMSDEEASYYDSQNIDAQQATEDATPVSGENVAGQATDGFYLSDAESIQDMVDILDSLRDRGLIGEQDYGRLLQIATDSIENHTGFGAFNSAVRAMYPDLFPGRTL